MSSFGIYRALFFVLFLFIYITDLRDSFVKMIFFSYVLCGGRKWPPVSSNGILLSIYMAIFLCAWCRDISADVTQELYRLSILFYLFALVLFPVIKYLSIYCLAFFFGKNALSDDQIIT